MRRRGGGAISQIWKELGGKVPGQKVQVPYNTIKRENRRKEWSKGERRGKREWGDGKKKKKGRRVVIRKDEIRMEV